MSDTPVRIQDDLYEAVNGEWLKTAVIPDDRPMTGGFSDLDQDVEKILMADFAAFAKGEKTSDIPEMKYAVLLYQKVLDSERRNREGIEPLLPLLAEIQAIQTPEDLNKAAAKLLLAGVDLPFDMTVETDMKDTSKQAFNISGPSIILPDTSYYAEGNPAGPQLLQIYSVMVSQLLQFTPLSAEEQQQYLKDTLAYDALIAKKVKSQVEWSEYFKCYNPMTVSEVAACTAPFDLTKVLKDLYGDQAPEILIAADPKAIKEMNGYFSEENFKLYVHWAYVKALVNFSTLLSEQIASTGRIFSRAMMGVASDPVLEKQAYQMAAYTYAEPVGVYYGRTYFGEEAKKDVVSLVKRIIETYQVRIERNPFLKAATKETAIRKLSAITIKMGYPDEIREFWSKLVIDEKDSFYEAMCKIGAIRRKDRFDKLLKPTDRKEWAMPGHMVNACYDPFRNDITFPAAILQKPFYSLKQSISENLGGIGSVIGHEISHAFDNNGAHFDETGSLNDWWTEEDLKAFNDLTEKMVAQYDGIPYHGGKVNGALTVSENIADNGGVAVTLEIMHTLKDADFRAYFINFAKVWCQKAKEEFIQLLLNSDVHSPAEVRANYTPRNFNEWYEAFGVTANDGMYLAPEKRISIW